MHCGQQKGRRDKMQYLPGNPNSMSPCPSQSRIPDSNPNAVCMYVGIKKSMPAVEPVEPCNNLSLAERCFAVDKRVVRVEKKKKRKEMYLHRSKS